ncbi:hypothetical protein D1BOALGB6SA_6781 [Olavius sp. associated proteobacterium Delta 1]|nr:hypothetical protein D1BOALGB6SA_6781 [Olavius sp. associated proteobacterium Delta 1]
MILGLIAFTTASWGDYIGEVIQTEGVAELQKAEIRQKGLTEKWEKLSYKDEIFLADTIRTGATGKVETLLEYHDVDAVWSLLENGIMYFDEEEPICKTRKSAPRMKKRIAHLDRGTVRGAVSPHAAAGSVTEIRTPNAVVCVPGTTFILRFIPPDTTELITLEGFTIISSLELARRPVVEGVVWVEVEQSHSSQVVKTAAPTAPERVSPEALKRAQELRVTPEVDQTVHPTELLPTRPQPDALVRQAELRVPIEVPGDPSASPALIETIQDTLLQIEFDNPNQ